MNQYKLTTSHFSIDFTSWDIHEDFLILTFEIFNYSPSTINLTSIFLECSDSKLSPVKIPEIYKYVIFNKVARPSFFNNYFIYSSRSTIRHGEIKCCGLAFKINSQTFKNFNFIAKFGIYSQVFPLYDFLQDNDYKISEIFPEYIEEALRVMNIIGF